MVISLVVLCAHMHTLIPDQAFSRKGYPVGIRYVFCHPFEHDVHATKRPETLRVVAPDGTVEDLLPALVKDGEWFRFAYTPERRGDHYVLLTAPVAVEDGAAVRESAKLILHVQSQQGWERPVAGEGLDIVPLTRPYGIRPGSAFRGRVLWRGAPVGNCRLEVEMYNETPPKEVPADEFVTAAAVTDEAGIFVVSVPERGWWSVTATKEGETEARDGAQVPVTHRMTFWFSVGVD